MKTESFDYDLPKELIAQSPVLPRDNCKLLVLNRSEESLSDTVFYKIGDFLREGDVVVFNNTEVIPARIKLEHEGRPVEIFLTRQQSDNKWLAIGSPGKMLKIGAKYSFEGGESVEIVNILEDGQRLVRFSVGGMELEELLKKIGAPPYPPYVTNENIDFEEYQTIYASKKGSVAAPTAGLHFTAELMSSLKDKGIQLEEVTLHVGLGTFQPVKAEHVEDHKMHSEVYSLDEEVAVRLNAAMKEGRRIIAVGTTSVRVLESCYDANEGFQPGYGETDIYIYPGYQWKCVNALITNFHLPKSSLILLVSSFAGKDFVFKAYQHAVDEKYRFYSFGDAMFIE
ncbi:tRNA preQ1(34) S-adenosylmethionine ribosyltransferase-isomerase QueA [Pseudomonadota bacterium]